MPTAKVLLKAPAGMVMEPGTVKAGALLPNETTAPPTGAGLESVMVQILETATQFSELSGGGVSMEMTPPDELMDTSVAFGVAPCALLRVMGTLPLAAWVRVTETTATTPSAIAVLFTPERIHVELPLLYEQSISLSRIVGDTETESDATLMGGYVSCHWIDAGEVPVEPAELRLRFTV